jgi:hypothetical protein
MTFRYSKSMTHQYVYSLFHTYILRNNLWTDSENMKCTIVDPHTMCDGSGTPQFGARANR